MKKNIFNTAIIEKKPIIKAHNRISEYEPSILPKRRISWSDQSSQGSNRSRSRYDSTGRKSPGMIFQQYPAQ
jgi:hypothetical protein